MGRRILVAFLLFFNNASAQVVLNIASLPKNTLENSTIYVSGNFNSWAPNDSAYMLKKKSNGTYFIELPISNRRYEFKFTQGSWASSEISLGGGDIPNRTLFSSSDTTVEIRIENWKANEEVVAKKWNKTVFVFSEIFPMKKLDKTRRVWIYLPQDYTTRLDKSYPVLYMHDGQNLFDNSFAFNGEWEVDETLTEIEKNGDPGVIVVGIDNGGASRLDEYSPWKNEEYGGGKGKEYLDFIVNELKPVIDILYRTKSDRENTGMMGSSMAGLITLYAASKYETTFSKFGVLSPALWFSDSIYTIPKKINPSNISKIYLLSGILESSTQAQETYNMRDTLLKHGYLKNEIRCEIKNDGTHTEWFWKREFAAAYKWLYAQPSLKNK